MTTIYTHLPETEALLLALIKHTDVEGFHCDACDWLLTLTVNGEVVIDQPACACVA